MSISDSDSDQGAPGEVAREYHHFKVVLLGGASVGKTSLALNLTGAAFNERYHSTTGFQVYTRSFSLLPGAEVILQ